MSDDKGLIFKTASEPWEFEQIHQLNYETFVEEIPQHQQNQEHKLIDKYHGENTYVICARGREVLGMIALRDQRPLSLDQKLNRLESYLPPFNNILEYRLLAVRQAYRNSAIFTGIMKKPSIWRFKAVMKLPSYRVLRASFVYTGTLDSNHLGPWWATRQHSFNPCISISIVRWSLSSNRQF